MVALYYKNNVAVGVRTLTIEADKNAVIIENGCIVNPR